MGNRRSLPEGNRKSAIAQVMMGLIITCNRYGTLAVRSLNEPERNRKSAIAQVMMGMMLS